MSHIAHQVIHHTLILRIVRQTTGYERRWLAGICEICPAPPRDPLPAFSNPRAGSRSSSRARRQHPRFQRLPRPRRLPSWPARAWRRRVQLSASPVATAPSNGRRGLRISAKEISPSELDLTRLGYLRVTDGRRAGRHAECHAHAGYTVDGVSVLLRARGAQRDMSAGAQRNMTMTTGQP
jgi:hypothetical protein